MNNQRWMWLSEKFRNKDMPYEAVDAYNPAPLLVKAQSLEELTEIVDKFNSDYGYTDLYDDGLVIEYSRIVTRSTIDFFQLDQFCREVDLAKMMQVRIRLPSLVYADLIQMPEILVNSWWGTATHPRRNR